MKIVLPLEFYTGTDFVKMQYHAFFVENHRPIAQKEVFLENSPLLIKQDMGNG